MGLLPVFVLDKCPPLGPLCVFRFGFAAALLEQLEKAGAANDVLPDAAMFTDLVQIHGCNAMSDRTDAIRSCRLQRSMNCSKESW